MPVQGVRLDAALGRDIDDGLGQRLAVAAEPVLAHRRHPVPRARKATQGGIGSDASGGGCRHGPDGTRGEGVNNVMTYDT